MFIRGGWDGDVCCSLRYGFVTSSGRRREMVICSAFSVMVCYRVRETMGIGNVCCIKRFGLLHSGGNGGKW